MAIRAVSEPLGPCRRAAAAHYANRPLVIDHAYCHMLRRVAAFYHWSAAPFKSLTKTIKLPDYKDLAYIGKMKANILKNSPRRCSLDALFHLEHCHRNTRWWAVA